MYQQRSTAPWISGEPYGPQEEHAREPEGLGFEASVYVAALAQSLAEQAKAAAESILQLPLHAPHPIDPDSREFSLHTVYDI